MKKLLLIILVGILFGLSLPQPVKAQFFAGDDADSYYCPPERGPMGGDKTVGFLCADGQPALPKPPSLRQAELWFVTLIYALWGFAGIIFTMSLMYLGFLYMTSQGSPDAIGKVKTRLQQWAIGFSLVFLSYPILRTVFSYIGLNQCLIEGVEMPGFQFFFESALDPAACDDGTTIP